MLNLFLLIVLIFSIVIHEVAHGTAAFAIGDYTAKNAGRLTLNPLKHLDPIGSFVVPLVLILTTGVGFGWAKPVPVNPYNFRDQRWGELKVSLAGPLANLAVAFVFGIVLRFSSDFSFLPADIYLLFSFIVFLNILLAVFNLIPIPPLDGSHILFSVFPNFQGGAKSFLARYGFIILVFLIFFVPWFFEILLSIVSGIFSLIVGNPFFQI